jgi:hypothetical protein
MASFPQAGVTALTLEVVHYVREVWLNQRDDERIDVFVDLGDGVFRLIASLASPAAITEGDLLGRSLSDALEVVRRKDLSCN